MSDEKNTSDEATPALTPLPCIVCGKQLERAANDPAFDHVPYAGTLFTSPGHYGSTAFDSFEGYRLQIVVCDDCLRGKAADNVRLVAPGGKTMVPWDGEADTIEGQPTVEPQTLHDRNMHSHLAARRAADPATLAKDIADWMGDAVKG